MNRDRMLVIRYGAVEYGNGGYSSRLSSRLIREQVMPNEELEAVAITRDQKLHSYSRKVRLYRSPRYAWR